MNNDYVLTNMKNIVFYDLETNGLDYYTTGILQFTLLDSDGNILLNQYSYPFNNNISGTEIHGIDLNKLKENKAITSKELCVLIKKIIRNRFGRNDIYFVAYNNFGYDQIILENNFKICNIKIPLNWYFVDLFPLVKEYIEYKSVPNFKLKTIYEYVCGVDDNIQYHCSLADTICLYKIFVKLQTNEDFPIYIKKYTRSLLQNSDIFKYPISTVNGFSNGMMFEVKGIYTIGDLYNTFKNMEYGTGIFDFYLKNKINIYSDFYRKNIVKQMDAIHNLQ
jgi:DNA polymerase III epsilon subunit-like protein